eukprot:4372669-Pleurochrysis_carterae.AAC.1
MFNAEGDVNEAQNQRVQARQNVLDAEAKLSAASAAYTTQSTRLATACKDVGKCMFKSGPHYSSCVRKEKSARDALGEASAVLKRAE